MHQEILKQQLVFPVDDDGLVRGLVHEQIKSRNSVTALQNKVVEGEPRDAASVVLVRDASAGGLEVFLLRRGTSTTVLNGAYVFPGGRVDEEDSSAAQIEALNLDGDASVLLGEPDLSPERAASMFVAACRETFEETGVRIPARDLLPLSRWITPKVPAMMTKRFDTRFFVAAIHVDVHATHDGQEADASVWYSPREALERYRDREINLAPPQIMSLVGLMNVKNFAEVKAQLQGRVPHLVEPMSYLDGESRVIAYPGNPKHSVKIQAMPGPTALVFRDNRFEPLDGFEAFFR
jgi:8-oxo-dGTP pyrophosphatase MutT (NUDIX family)